MTGVSDHVADLYRDAYADGREKQWRDAGAIDKADNIINRWKASGVTRKPRVIEIGCGDGAVGDRLARSNFFASYTGYDISTSAIAEAEQRNVPGVAFKTYQGDALPEDDDAADLVILSHVVEHLEHPRQVLYEARRVAPWVFVEVPLELHLRTPHDHQWSDLGHINAYSPRSIRHLVQTCRLEVVDQETSNPRREASLFASPSFRSRVMFRVKDTTLKVAEPVATQLMTYHSSLLAKRQDDQPAS